MEPIDYDAWEVDIPNGRARHASGFTVTVEGDVRDPSAVAPADYPAGLSYAEQARLLRYGMEALASAPEGQGRSQRVPQQTSRARQAEEKARLFAERKDRPERPRLSLKKPRS